MKRLGFNDGWEFSRDDGPCEAVVVPHDAMLGNRRGPDAPAASASGYYHGARYAYRKAFSLDEAQAEGVALLEFEGVYRDTRIIVNGVDVPAPPYGFVPFFVDVTGVVHSGRNEIEVYAENASQPDCRWYSGGGIHRPVWLWTGGTNHIQPEGVRVATLATDPARIQVQVVCTGGVPNVRIEDAAGTVVGTGRGELQEFAVPDAKLWSDETPYLYRCCVSLEVDGQVVDTAETRFGIRTLTWGSFGLRVNGRETLLRGGCIHCDNGIVGAASHPESEWRRVRLLKQAGFNAIRVAHNPAPAALLDACDALGMYVMDETWDMWFTPKSRHDYARHFLDWCDYDLQRLTSRDFNHPSVIMYSIGNEVADPIEPGGVELEQSLVALLHALDPTRPVTCGFNLTMMVMERIGRGWYDDAKGVADAASSVDEPPRSSMLFNLTAQGLGTGMTMLANVPGADALVSPALDALDIAGYNYAAARYPVDVHAHPERTIVGSETFPHRLPANWRKVREYPQLVGDFMWAAWDYLGEAGAGSWAYTPEEAGFSKPWPWLLAGSGALDIMGNPGAPAALAAAVWQTAAGPSIQVRPVNIMDGRTFKATWRGSDAIPSWSWRGCEGMPAQVEVYDGRAHAIRLELNGQVVDEKRVREYVAKFSLEYQPGTLEAIALGADGCELGRDMLHSATGDLRLRIDVEPSAIAPAMRPCSTEGDIVYAQIAIVGENGIVESNANMLLRATVEGGDLLAFGSPCPATEERYQDGAFTTYRGRAQAIIHCADSSEAHLIVEGPDGLRAEACLREH
ncbi:MAG: glycoside hydrolase family 2 TIM barrel-domain containing protein [Coriobacteriia bacterium]|nr:glycoside hydrolase family 2 TIM barrel-domain containing protein [Coriobacteriia bacterium]